MYNNDQFVQPTRTRAAWRPTESQVAIKPFPKYLMMHSPYTHTHTLTNTHSHAREVCRAVFDVVLVSWRCIWVFETKTIMYKQVYHERYTQNYYIMLVYICLCCDEGPLYKYI